MEWETVRSNWAVIWAGLMSLQFETNVSDNDT